MHCVQNQPSSMHTEQDTQSSEDNFILFQRIHMFAFWEYVDTEHYSELLRALTQTVFSLQDVSRLSTPIGLSEQLESGMKIWRRHL